MNKCKLYAFLLKLNKALHGIYQQSFIVCFLNYLITQTLISYFTLHLNFQKMMKNAVF